LGAQRFTILATLHLDLQTHFILSDSDVTVWKAYANDGLQLPIDASGGSEGQRLCRQWGARAGFSSSDKFAIHHQFTDTPEGSFWCSTHVATDLSGHAFTVGVRFEDARVFRGRRTNTHERSSCPSIECCPRTHMGNGQAVRSQFRLVSLLSPGLPGVEEAAVDDFISTHAGDPEPPGELDD
jgi:hypothetical protein